jgi:hypothetical protein
MRFVICVSQAKRRLSGVEVGLFCVNTHTLSEKPTAAAGHEILRSPGGQQRKSNQSSPVNDAILR